MVFLFVQSKKSGKRSSNCFVFFSPAFKINNLKL